MEGTIGEIRLFGGNFTPQGWQFCDGSAQSIANYQAAFSVVGTAFGGDGMNTFNLPDLRGRVPVGTGTGAGLAAIQLGQVGGTENLPLNVNNMPAHTHAAAFTGKAAVLGGYTASINVSTKAATTGIPGQGGASAIGAPFYRYDNTVDPVVNVPVNAFVKDTTPSLPISGFTATQTGASGGGTVTNTAAGSSLPLPGMQPYVALNYIICLEGIFPAATKKAIAYTSFLN